MSDRHRAIVTVIGHDQKGVVARISTYLADANNRAAAQYGRVAQPVDETGRPIEAPRQAIPLSPQAERIARLRLELAEVIRAGDAPRAGRLYAELIQADPEQALPAVQQVDLGSYLMTDGQYDLASAAYESLLNHYPTYENRQQIELMLGLIYGRYLNNPMRAKQYLEHCQPRLRDASQRELCQRELAHVNGMLGGEGSQGGAG